MLGLGPLDGGNIMQTVGSRNARGLALLDQKYDNLWKAIITAGWNDESSGDVEAPCGFFTITSYSPADAAGFQDLLSHQDYGSDFQQLFTELETGFYVTTENSLGMIFVFHVQTEAEAREWYRLMSNEYVGWEDADV
jgi:hypothetical protein